MEQGNYSSAAQHVSVTVYKTASDGSAKHPEHLHDVMDLLAVKTSERI